jgi:ActR/RegA family two-component response regulator
VHHIWSLQKDSKGPRHTKSAEAANLNIILRDEDAITGSEDDVTLRESLVQKLTAAGFAVEQAADVEGLYYAQEYPIDLAIIDLGLPEISDYYSGTLGR